MYLIGYDIGSSSIKTALVDSFTGQVIDTIQSPNQEMDIVARQSGWAEQQPDIWWNHVCLSTNQIIRKNNIDPNDIASVGIAYQMHGLVLVDEHHQVLRPSIIWCDSRAAPIGQQAYTAMGEEYCMKNLLNSPGNFTASKLKWVKDNEPEIFQKIHKIMLPGDYIAMKLSGEITTTIGGLSEAILWNFKKKEIAYEVLDYYEINHELLPKVISVFTDQLQVHHTAAQECGLKSGIKISYRAGDQPNNALSLKVLHPGEVAATSGTSGVVYGIVDRPIHDEHLRINSFSHVNYDKNFDRIGTLLCINGAGIQYAWLKQQIARSNQSYDDMERMVTSVPVGSEGVCVLPFGNGAERMFDNRNLESHIFNIEFNRHTRAHMYRASLEGVAFSFVHGIKILKDMGLQTDVIRVGNDNMFQSTTFATTIATLLNCKIDIYDTTGAIGAARASGHAIGIYPKLEDAFMEMQALRTIEPSYNLSMCKQAYNYWQSSLEKMLNTSQHANGQIKMLRHHKDELVEENKVKNRKIINQGILIDKLKSELIELRIEIDKVIENSSFDEIQRLTKKIESISDDIEIESALESNLKYLNNPFINKLSRLHPELSFEDLKLCYLLEMKMRTKEIAQSLNLSVRGVETKRYRLKKKLNLSKEQSVYNYLNTI